MGCCDLGGRMTPKRHEHVVVLGASLSGLLASRVLADFYDSVTVVERDVLPMCPANRRGVPQGAHAHVLLARCSQILDELFPGFLDDLVADGVPVWGNGDLSKLDLSFGGHRLVRTGTVREPMVIYYPNRPFLEGRVRQRMQAVSNITILDGHAVETLTSTADGERVTGVRVVDRYGGAKAALTASLVVDATGRGSRTPAFLEDLGYDRPHEDELIVHLAYASQPLRIPPGILTERNVGVFPAPGRPTGFTLVGHENDTWVLTVGAVNSRSGYQAPRGFAEMLSVVEEFGCADAAAAVRAGTPLDEVSYYHVPSNRWRRYDKLRRIPQGLLVIGDAVCSFNPLYAQGMTVAALEAIVLRDCLRHGRRDLPRRFFRASAKKIGVAWQTAVGSDLAMPEIVGPRSVSTRIANAFLNRVLTAAETDPVVAERFLRVTGMIDGPARLLSPALILRLAKVNRRPPLTPTDPIQSSCQ
jgi:2-polyprenyl-6-methoxyphenol hydroxylase-like FAD-dependent oxidoreductase